MTESKWDINKFSNEPVSPKRLEALSCWEECCEKIKHRVDTTVTDIWKVKESGEDAIACVEALQELALKILGVACSKCNGRGKMAYASTSTWRGGVGCSSITYGVCDSCWGTGRTDKKGTDLRKMEAHLEKLEKEVSLRWFKQEIGVQMDIIRKYFPTIAKKLQKARWGGDFLLHRCVDNLVRVLNELSEE